MFAYGTHPGPRVLMFAYGTVMTKTRWFAHINDIAINTHSTPTHTHTRFWGTPLPIWHSDDWEEIVCVGSVEELHKLSGVLVTDLHKVSLGSNALHINANNTHTLNSYMVSHAWYYTHDMRHKTETSKHDATHMCGHEVAHHLFPSSPVSSPIALAHLWLICGHVVSHACMMCDRECG
jgi:hypothetical protein